MFVWQFLIDYWQNYVKYIWLIFSFCQSLRNTHTWGILNILNILLSSSIVPWLMLESTADISENFLSAFSSGGASCIAARKVYSYPMEILKSTNNCSKGPADLNIYTAANNSKCLKFYPWQQLNFASLQRCLRRFYGYTNNIKLMFGILRGRNRNSMNICKYTMIKCSIHFSES